MWNDYKQIELSCFICNATVAYPTRPLILPDPAHLSQQLILPLCKDCEALDTMTRFRRSLKIIWSMHKARTGKRLNLNLLCQARGEGDGRMIIQYSELRCDRCNATHPVAGVSAPEGWMQLPISGLD